MKFCHLRERKFKQDFKDTLKRLSCCSIEVDTKALNFLCCHFYNAYRDTLMNNLENITICFSAVSDNNPISFLLYGGDKFDNTKNRRILMSAIRFIKDSQRSGKQFW